ncbi:Nramp family divalent metal transporter [Athalassotoga saccharophila]|uniref:Nramp family divalent metal transporter n=1 Tax=Athalassotoga saccharophila TaxID=1441386 RepID=UPI0013794FEC|nr:Nramp family divalent metal transporter [Athalassotoga saccharophila]BBJ27743.1 divalent metal cation transporter MntH [Athalassotoga saccharophila]
MENIMKKMDQKTIARGQMVLNHTEKRRGFARLLPFLGPAFIASVAYVDPGNFATNIQGGATFGYELLWVILWANLMAMFIQALSSKLGIATGKNLATLISERYPKGFVWFYWIQTEIIAIFTDLAEFLGASIAFQLLLGVPLFVGAILSGIATIFILFFQDYGFRPFEIIITLLLSVIAFSYVTEIFISKPNGFGVLGGTLIPKFSGPESVYMAAGILGATVMPHVIYLHSALTENRIKAQNEDQLKRLHKFNLLDVLIAMGIAGFVNMAMLMMAASTFHFTGHQDVSSISTAYMTLIPLLGGAAGFVFAISLLASGLSSSAVGTMSGQVLMQSFVKFKIPIWIRRIVTMIPSFIVIFLGINPTNVLVFSQVVLSFGIVFALVPLIQFTRDKTLMGKLANGRFTNILSWMIASSVIALNAFLIISQFI